MQPQFLYLRPHTPSRLARVEQPQVVDQGQKEATAVLGRLSLLRAEDLERTQATTAAMVALAEELMHITSQQLELLVPQQSDKEILAESNQLLQLIAQAAAVARVRRAAMQLTGETVALDQMRTILGQPQPHLA
jgi:hypothetical protein